MQPINYMQGYQNPLESILGQVQAYQNLSQNANTLRSQKAQSELEKAISERKIRAMQDLQNVDYNNIHALREQAMRYADLEYSKGVQAHLAQFDEKQRKAEIGRVSQTLSLLKNGKNDVAIDDLLAQAQAYENAGDSQNAQGARQMVELIRKSPQSALQQTQRLFGMMVPKEQMESYAKMIEAEKPTVQYQSMGGYGQVIKTDPTTGQVTTQYVGDITQSPDNVANNERAMAVAQGGWQNAKDVAHIQGGYDLQERQMQEAGANARTQAQMQVDLQKQQMEMAYKAQQERAKNGQMLVDENGYQFIYYPNEGRAEYMLDPNGQRVKPYSADTAKALKAERDRFNKLTTSLNEAMKLLPDSTGSLVGTWVDGTLGAFGVSTKGAEVGAKLKSIGGQLTSLMPRMEGPQSNMDVQMYEKMAGDVGNTKIPIAQRIEALKTVQDLANKYAHLQGVYTDEYASKNTQTSQPTPTSYDSMKLK